MEGKRRKGEKTETMLKNVPQKKVSSKDIPGFAEIIWLQLDPRSQLFTKLINLHLVISLDFFFKSV